MGTSIGELVGFVGLDDSKFGDVLSGVFDKFKDAGGKITKLAGGFGAGAATALAGGLVGSMNIDAANDKLAAQLGLSSQDADRLGGIAGKLYADNFGDSIGQVDEALNGIATNMVDLSKVTDTQTQAMAASALNVAEAFDQDLGGVTRAAGQLMKTGLAKNGQEALDLIARGMQNGDNVADDLLDTLTEYPTQFRKLGLSGADALGLMHQGIVGGARDSDIVADAIKEFSIRAVDGSDTTAQAFKALHLPIQNTIDAIAAGGPTARAAFGTVLERLKGVKDPATQAQIAVGLFGTQAEDLGKALYGLDLDTAAKGMGKVSGASKDLGKTMHDNATSNLSSFARQVQTTFVTWVGGKALPTAQHFAKTLTTGFGPALSVAGDILKNQVLPAAKAVFGFLGDHQTTIKVIAGLLAGVLIPLLIAWGVRSIVAGGKSVAAWAMTQGAAVKSAATQAAQLAGMVGKWVAVAAAATVNALKVVAGWVLMGAQSLLQAARVAAAWLIAIGPIALVVAAVVGLVVLIVKNWDTIWSATVAVWNAVKDAIVTAAQAVIGFLQAHWPLILAIITGPIGLVVLAIVKNWNTIKSATSTAWNAVKGFVSGAINSVVGFVTGLPGRIVALGGRMLGAGKTLMTKLFDGIKSAASAVGGFAASIGTAIVNKIIDGLNAVVPHSLPIHINAGPIHFNKDIPLIPRIPHVSLAEGGITTGRTFAEIGEAGTEAVLPLTGRNGRRAAAALGMGQPTVIEIRSDGGDIANMLLGLIRERVRVYGGDVQSVLGR